MTKRIKIILIACSLPFLSTMAQESSQAIHTILQQVEENNKELRANQQLVAAQKLENKSSNNLSNPKVSYAHLWDAKNSEKTVSEMVVAQSFDFPTLYFTRSKINRLKSQSLNAEANALRQEVLLKAQELCLDIIMLHQQQMLLEERLKNAEELAIIYQKRLDNGDANILETNKIKLELLNVRTESRSNQTTLANKLKELSILNGNLPLNAGRSLLEGQIVQPTALGLTDYEPVPLPTDFSPICEDLIANDPIVQAAVHQDSSAQKMISASKQGWLPSLEIGYRRNTESGHPLNGVVVGLSLPIFENHGKVKAAKAQATSSRHQKENAILQAKANLWQLYEEASSLHRSLKEYKDMFDNQQNLNLLKRALEGGEINMIEYFVEVSVIYQSHNNFLMLENQYQKAMARLYRSRL